MVLHHAECHSLQAVSNFDLFTLDDVDTAFANSIQLKYQQHYQLAGAWIVYIVLFLWTYCISCTITCMQLPRCDAIKPLFKFSCASAGKGEGMTITPYAAGHLLGGTIWKITKDTEEIIYAVDFNHRKERSAFVIDVRFLNVDT